MRGTATMQSPHPLTGTRLQGKHVLHIPGAMRVTVQLDARQRPVLRHGVGQRGTGLVADLQVAQRQALDVGLRLAERRRELDQALVRHTAAA